MPGVLEPGLAGLGGALCLCLWRPWCEALLGRENVEVWAGVSLLVGEDYICVSQWQRQLRKGHRETWTQMPISASS